MPFFKALFNSDKTPTDVHVRRTPSDASSFFLASGDLVTGATNAAWCIKQHDERIWVLRTKYHQAWDQDRLRKTQRTREEMDRVHEVLRKATAAQYVKWLLLNEYCRVMDCETTDFYQGPQILERDRAMRELGWWERFQMWLRWKRYTLIALADHEVAMN